MPTSPTNVQLPALMIPAIGGRYEQVVSTPLGETELWVPEAYDEVKETEVVSAVTTVAPVSPLSPASSYANTGWFVITEPDAPATGCAELVAVG